MTSLSRLSRLTLPLQTLFWLAFSLETFAEDDTWQWPEFNGLIAGAISQDNLPYKQVDTQQQPSLLVFGRLGDVFIEGNRAGLPLKRFDFGSLSLMGQLRTHQYLDADDTDLTDQDREQSIELGPQISIPLGQGYVSQFSVLQDISGKHDGQEYEAAIYKRFIFDDLRIVATLALQYQSKDLLDYYVGTNSYSPQAELTQEVELLGVYDISDAWSAVLVWRYYQHGQEFRNSPLTNGDTSQRVAIGVGRNF
ncbi:MAG: MipA/OmpV family protein [Gammaproteobacteria bacterium]|nr:MipA/OmpV family protein [Gammaproteobacteria bacterium]